MTYMGYIFYLPLSSLRDLKVPCRLSIHLYREEIVAAQQTLAAERKHALILRSKASTVGEINIGDLFDVYIRLPLENHGRWRAPR